MAEAVSSLSQAALAFRAGLYRHYTGDLYRAWFVARSSEQRDQEFVVYQSLERGWVWVRPLNMFLETVEVNGKQQPRFERIGE